MATTISTTLAAGAVESPYYYDVVITKKLCKMTCDNPAPIFNPTFSLVSSTLVGTNQYELVINVQGIVTFTPCGSCECNARSQVVNENFVLPYYSATAPTSIAVAGTPVRTSIKTSGCSNCGNVMVCDCALTLTI